MALATDYDGTLARHGTVDETTLAAIQRLTESGRKAIMVTGREIPDLKNTFSRLDVFDLIVAENGGILYFPATDQIEALHKPVPRAFADELRARGVNPLSIGQVLVATQEPNESVLLDVIKKMGLELEIIFNKGAVMVLPTGTNKATGLSKALKRLGLFPENTVGIGDAENDHALLQYCGCGIAVANAIPALKETADFTTSATHGAGVTEAIDLLIATDLAQFHAARPQEAPVTQ